MRNSSRNLNWNIENERGYVKPSKLIIRKGTGQIIAIALNIAVVKPVKSFHLDFSEWVRSKRAKILYVQGLIFSRLTTRDFGVRESETRLRMQSTKTQTFQ